MNTYLTKRLFKKLSTTLPLLALLTINTPAFSEDLDEDTTLTKTIDGVTVTGVNNIKGKPFYDWGWPFFTYGFPTMGIYNENGNHPLPVDENTPDSAIIATSVDEQLLALTGKTLEDVRPEWLNLPIRQVPVNTDFAFVERNSLRGVLTADPLEFAQAEPSSDITLGEWMSARGKAKIVCENNNKANIKLTFESMIPNRMYAVFGTMGIPQSGGDGTGDGNDVGYFPIPLGGAPSIFVTDKDGAATFERILNFCPMVLESSDRPLLGINITYHANHQNYGAVPEPGFLDGYWLGLARFIHIQFPVNTTPL